MSISPSGSSYWARTAKIETQTPNGESDAYFIKVPSTAPLFSVSLLNVPRFQRVRGSS